MNANELRLGNYVMIHDYAKGNRQQTVEELGVCQVNLLDEQYCTPIPLTEEWLLKFGFETWETEVSLQIYDFWQLYNLKIAIYKGNFYTDINAKKIFIKHVHQLQNLYFALTSEELTIKL